MGLIQEHPFSIGNILIPGNVILAPMDGYTDQPFRLFIRELGSFASISEFINGIDISRGNPHLEKRISFDEKERPFGYQILDDDINRILKAAHFLEKKNPDFLDINLGCPSKPVVHRGAGAALLKDPGKIREIFTRLTTEIKLPVTAKIRTGWDQISRNYTEIARILEESGVRAVFMHARTRKQGYTGQADWDAIAEVKQKIQIPVIGNGDIRLVEDIQQMINHTHCDGVMIGRTAVSNPWIFSGLNRDQVSKDKIMTSFTRLIDLLQEFYGEELGLKLVRKYLCHIMEPLNLNREQRTILFNCAQREILFSMLDQILPENSG